GLILSIAIDILSEEGDFLVSLRGKKGAFFDNTVGMSGDFWTPCVRDDAVGAMFVASADNGHIGLDFIFTLCAQIIEFMGKLVVCANYGPAIGDHFIENVIEIVNVICS